jgi:hypothetical protein
MKLTARRTRWDMAAGVALVVAAIAPLASATTCIEQSGRAVVRASGGIVYGSSVHPNPCPGCIQ